MPFRRPRNTGPPAAEPPPASFAEACTRLTRARERDDGTVPMALAAVCSFYDRMETDPAVASSTLAAALHELAVLLTEGQPERAHGLFRRSADVYGRLAAEARSRGHPDIAATADALRTEALVKAQSCVARPEQATAAAPPGSPDRVRQDQMIAAAAAERARFNMAWAQNLGRI